MKVTLFDRTEILVSQEQGEKLKRSLLKSQEGYVDINGTTIKKSAILKIGPGGKTEADVAKQNNPNLRLRSDNRSAEEQYKSARKASNIIRKQLEKRGILKNKHKG